MEREATGMVPDLLSSPTVFPLILHCLLCHGAAYSLSRIQNTHTGILAPKSMWKEEWILPRPLESLVSFGRLELLFSCECLRHLLDAIHGCLHLGSSESLRNCRGIIKMQTIPRLHNSTCKRVSGWPWLFIEKPIKSPQLGSWTEYRFEDNILGPYGNQQPFPCMLQLLLPFVVHCPSSLITTPWNYIGIYKNVYSYTLGCFFAYCIPSPCMQKDNYHSTSSSRSMQSRLIMPPVLIPFTPFMSQKKSEWRARNIAGYEGSEKSNKHAEKLEPKSEQFRWK